jgi:hypothetical protein
MQWETGVEDSVAFAARVERTISRSRFDNFVDSFDKKVAPEFGIEITRRARYSLLISRARWNLSVVGRGDVPSEQLIRLAYRERGEHVRYSFHSKCRKQ